LFFREERAHVRVEEDVGNVGLEEEEERVVALDEQIGQEVIDWRMALLKKHEHRNDPNSNETKYILL
jgi:hypothetical protein